MAKKKKPSPWAKKSSLLQVKPEVKPFDMEELMKIIRGEK
tara:strand:- start:4057 stop:4176 length:120 start_codon:yes stop_codon:yes gene_type:complete